MDTAAEQTEAAELEQAIPGSSVTVENLATPDGEVKEVTIHEPTPPRDEMDLGFKFGVLLTEMDNLKAQNAALLGRLEAFEQATIAAVEDEAQALEEQREVLADVAEEVLPPDHAGANVIDPGHQAKNPSVWERLFGGHHGG